ncbi:C2 domain [Pseudocohnilembus persalinus]|uniref:C2 domain n=1 Tax=Pseudocohnilembus persalinus TaxID=266149 RepID=A0A0V0QP70_PSEPJ|nr:C2 domain [Pseudocohnilembus persalinus]|eukprot:KRX03949.1 C2 domain [Pseudocohnilembus persalinus]
MSIQQQVEQSFTNLGINLNSRLSQNDLIQALDQIIKGEFDREVAIQLFEQCETDYQNNIQVQDLVNIILKAIEILQQKVDNQQLHISQLSQQLQQAQQELQNQQGIARKNNFGIDTNSTLNVHCVEAKNLSAHQPFDSQPCCILTCGNQKFQTQQTQNGPTTEPQWDQQYEFSIQRGSEELIVEIIASNSRQQNNIILGECVIKLENLQNQEFISNWFDLYDENNQKLEAQIFLKIQYIYDYVKYYQDTIQELNSQIESNQNDLLDYQNDLNQILQCTGQRGSYAQPQIGNVINVNSMNQNNGLYQQQGFQNFQQDKQQMDQNAYMKPNQSNIVQSPYNQNDEVNHKGEFYVTGELQYMFYLALIIIALSLFQCLARSSFLDIVLGFSILFIAILDCFEKQYIKGMLFATGISVVLDVLWLHIFMGGLWSVEVHGDHDSQMQGTYQFVCVLAIIALILKVLLTYYLYEIYTKIDTYYTNKYCLDLGLLEYSFGHSQRNIFLEAFQQSENQNNNFNQFDDENNYQQQQYNNNYQNNANNNYGYYQEPNQVNQVVGY